MKGHALNSQQKSVMLSLIWVIAVILIWLGPLLLVGSQSVSWRQLPSNLRFQYGCAALFTRTVKSWSQAKYLVQLGDGAEWKEVPREWVSPMRVAGYRQRVDRIVPELNRSRSKTQMLDRLAAHVVDCVRLHEPAHPEVMGVRIINTQWPTDDPGMNRPQGKWQLPAFETLAPHQYKVLGTWTNTASGLVRAKIEKPKADQPIPSSVSTRSQLSRQLMKAGQSGRASLPSPASLPQPRE
jgi:hypothetical protein